MGLRFVLGRAGSGKTHTCLDAFRAAALADPQGPPLILLVPEQATFQMEQALLGDGGLKGMVRAQVLSFQRLAWRVSLAAGGLSRPPLSDIGKQMVLRALLDQRLDELRIFGQVADRPGFITKLAGTISELRTYQLGPAQLRRRLEGMDETGEAQTTLGAKLHDLAIVMGDLTDYTADRFTDPDDYLSVLAERLPESGVLAGAEVWVDSFTGFTPQELSVLGQVVSTASRVHVTLCLDPAELPAAKSGHTPADLFHPTLTTYDQLVTLVSECGATLEKPLILDQRGGSLPRFADTPELAHLERHFFRSGPPLPWGPELQSLDLVPAQNRRHEVEAAAREVQRIAREHAWRYRAINIVVRNMDAYADLVDTIFREHGIPVFVDRRRTIAHHPLVELLRASLEVIIQDWAYAPVFRFLKTDLLPVSRADIDTLENYVLEHGIRGRRWHDGHPWHYVRRYTLETESAPSSGSTALLDRMNRIRQTATGALVTFQRRIGGGRGQKPQSVRTLTAALFNLLEDLGVLKRLETWSADAELTGDLEGAREHEQVWEGVCELLDQMVEGLGDAAVTLPQFLHILSAGLDGLRLGLIPPGLDQVVVGTVERSRSSGIRATLILGATEKDFPPLPPEDAIFTDREREQMEASGLEVGPTSLLRLFQEQFFTYVAFTRASSRLWISYPIADEGGRALTPSTVVRKLQQLFPSLHPTVAGEMQPGAKGVLDGIATPTQLAAALARALRAHRSGYRLDPIWLDVYQWATSDETLRTQVSPTLAALRYEETFRHLTQPLGLELAHSLYGAVLTTSVSRLESFATCPFQHFVSYGLRLQERTEFEVAAPQLGLFYHAVMSVFVRQLQAEGVTWDHLTAADVLRRVDRVVDELAPRLQSEILLSDAQHRYVLSIMRRTVHAAMQFLGEHVSQGRFRPLSVEVPFGDEPDGLPAVEFSSADGTMVRLRGRIDRVDGWRGDDGTWHLRVMDYKSSPRSLDLGRFYHGLSLQLLLYLYTVMAHASHLVDGPVQAAGALYFPVHDPSLRLPGPEAGERVVELRRKQYRTRGLVTADAHVVQAMDLSGLGLTQAKLNKDGSISKSSPVVDADGWAHLFHHLEKAVGQLSSNLLGGDVAVAPARMGGQVPCASCAFRSVCQFDPAVSGQGYRSLETLKAPAVWDRLTNVNGGVTTDASPTPKDGEDHE